jgi:nucleotide-binding universal stress UspA family protein
MTETTDAKTAVTPTSSAQVTSAVEGKVVIAYDGSDESRRAIDVAAHLLGPRPALVVFVGPMPEAEGDAVLVGDLGVGDYEAIAGDEEAARERAVEGAEIAQKAGFSAEPNSVLASPAWMGIVDTADRVDAPVIVVGSRGLNRLRQDLEGSTSYDLARHSGRPVLIVPPASR